MPAAPTAALAPSNSLLVKLSARPDFAAVEKMARGAERKAAAYDALVKTAGESQKPFLAIAEKLKESGAISGYQTLVSPNMLIVTPKAGTTDALKAFEIDGVKAIYENSRGGMLWSPATGQAKDSARLLTPKDGKPWGLDVVRKPIVAEEPNETPYGIGLIGAPEAWKQGATGKGLVFGTIDTGTDFKHENLVGAYRGNNGDGSFTHDYNWVDFDSRSPSEPRDYDAHGTHTAGTAVGKTTGVAPEAKWISAHGLVGSVDAAIRSLQWMQAPTKVDGTAADATKAPDVVGMSWYMGRNSEDLFRDSIQNLRAAGIEVVKSAGNQGPGSKTITSPGQFPEIYAVAAVGPDKKVADFSSRGPSPWPKDGANAPLKPDFAAPGVDVVSSTPGGKYGKMSGTSMAQPHFSGATLSILSKYPQLTHDQLTQVLAAGAVDAGPKGDDVEYGRGIINLPAALDAAAKLVGGSKPARHSRRAPAPTPAAA